jgi:hypothetical protein
MYTQYVEKRLNASRMTQIEMSMQELLHHVRNLSVKSEP